ncbi:MAG: heavy-metal-associated protein [Flaviaesturariibacter sp.]|nr:heavy-metal-associated protein [Flaviaesturariibacter sp.]
MTCNSCVAKAKSQLLMLGDITEADVQLAAPQATITMEKHIPVAALQTALSKAGPYTITEADGGMHHAAPTEESRSWLATYKRILVIAAYIIGISFLIEVTRGRFNLESWMYHFMAAFFLVFSLFKMLDLDGFAKSYAMYDIVAKRWKGWGYAYPFIELFLGIAYLLEFNLPVTHVITFAVMSISIVGVLQSVLNKRKIQCACLGSVFNLPMSTVTIIEDALMIAMSGIMLISMMTNS